MKRDNNYFYLNTFPIYLQIFDNTLKTCFRRFGNTLCLEVKIKTSRLIMYLFLVFVIFTLVIIPIEVSSSVIGTTRFPGKYFMHRDQIQILLKPLIISFDNYYF